MIVYSMAVTFIAAFLAGFFAANLPSLKRKEGKKAVIIKADAENTLENFLNYNGEIQ